MSKYRSIERSVEPTSVAHPQSSDCHARCDPAPDCCCSWCPQHRPTHLPHSCVLLKSPRRPIDKATQVVQHSSYKRDDRSQRWPIDVVVERVVQGAVVPGHTGRSCCRSRSIRMLWRKSATCAEPQAEAIVGLVVQLTLSSPGPVSKMSSVRWSCPLNTSTATGSAPACGWRTPGAIARTRLASAQPLRRQNPPSV